MLMDISYIRVVLSYFMVLIILLIVLRYTNNKHSLNKKICIIKVINKVNSPPAIDE